MVGSARRRCRDRRKILTLPAGPIVSIITPCHNGGCFLPALLESVSRQTFGNWEHIVVDDGSTDDSVAAVEERITREPRLHLIRQRRTGVATARNAGFNASHPGSRYVYFLDADDLLEPDMLETMIGYLDQHPAVAVAYCDYRCIDADGRPVPKPPMARFVPTWWGVRRLRDDEPKTPLVSIYSWAPVMESLSVIRRSVFAANSGWDPAIGQPGEGVDLFTKISLTNEVHFVNRQLYTYRRHSAQASHDAARLARQDAKVQRKWRDRSDLTPAERTRIEAAQRFRMHRLKVVQSLGAALRYVRRGELHHGLHCCVVAGRTVLHGALGRSPWPSGL